MSDLYARPGQAKTFLFEGAPAGLVGTVSFRIVDLAGSVVFGPVTVGITEPVPGNYVFAGTAPTPGADTDYLAVWNDGAEDFVDTLHVTAQSEIGEPLPDDTLTYTTVAELESYTGGTGLDTDAAERLLTFAERDIDRAAGVFAMFPNGRKFDPPRMVNVQASALSLATCAQAEYRLAKGEQFFIEDQPDSLSAPDYSRQGKEPRIGPKAKEHLWQGGLLRRTARMR